ncbi:MAG TPA: hypothetical protein VL943_01730 [Niabella sp.]|nr:hypothetical protein [Niabella sp.]
MKITAFLMLMLTTIFSQANAECIASLAKLQSDKYFASTSFWYTPIPANVALHPNSANLNKEFNRQRTSWYQTVNINTREYTSPVYTVPADQPKIAIGWNDCQKKGFIEKGFLAQVADVPMPIYAKEAAGSDAEMTVYQPSTDTIWELWQAKKDANGKWIACWGGKLAGASKSAGIMPKPYGTTASGLPFVGGQITAEELERGEIKHAIGIALVDVEHFNIYSWPANRSDGYNPTKKPNWIAEGQRFRFDPSISVDSLNVSRAAKIIFKAGQKYGFVVWDKAGAVSIRAQNVSSYAENPYPALFDNKPAYEVIKNLPWTRIQFLPMNYGKPL